MALGAESIKGELESADGSLQVLIVALGIVELI